MKKQSLGRLRWAAILSIIAVVAVLTVANAVAPSAPAVDPDPVETPVESGDYFDVDESVSAVDVNVTDDVEPEADAENDEGEFPEDPLEAQKIYEALVADGYLSDEIPLDYDTQDILRTFCDIYGADIPDFYAVVLGVIQTESSFNPTAENPNSKCFGYMQINRCNAEWLYNELGVDVLNDPFGNLEAGVYMLSDLYEKYGDWHSALMCYNAGEGGAQTYYFSKGITSTVYSRTVMERSEYWRGVYK